MSNPITSRVKRTALFKYHPSPNKQTDKEKLGDSVKVGGSEAGPDKVIETDVMGEQTDFVADKDKREKDPEKWEKTRKGICDGSIKGDKSKVNCDDVVVDKKKETVKGDDLDYDTTLMQSNTGTVLQPWEQAKMISNIKRSGRNVRKATNKLDKATNKDKKYIKKHDKNNDGKLDESEIDQMPTGFLGIFGNKKKAYQRNAARLEENKVEKDALDAMQKNTGLAAASGKVQGGTYQKADTEVTKGQRTPEQQKAEAKRLAIKKAKEDKAAKDKADTEAAKKVANDAVKQNVAETTGVTTGQAANAIGTGENTAINLGGGYGSALDLYKTSSYGPVATMTRKGYNMKPSSPATKKLQGSQNKSPQHLQAAIKAAPGKKMRSGFKMKGYGK